MKHLGLVSQTGLRLNQDYAIVQLGHLRIFYKRALEKILLVCILRQNKASDLF